MRKRSQLPLLASAICLIGCTPSDDACWDAFRDGYSQLDSLREERRLESPTATAVREQLAGKLQQCEAAPEYAEIAPDDVDSHKKGYFTQLDVAALANSTDAVTRLLKAGHSPVGPPEIARAHWYGGLSSLHIAAYFESSLAVAAMMKSTANLLHDPASSGETALHVAGSSTCEGLAAIALMGATPQALSAVTHAGDTPFDAAILEGDVRKAQCLTRLAMDLRIDLHLSTRARNMASRLRRDTALQWWDAAARTFPEQIESTCRVPTQAITLRLRVGQRPRDFGSRYRC